MSKSDTLKKNNPIKQRRRLKRRPLTLEEQQKLKRKIKGPKRLSNTKNYESRMRSRGKKVEEFSVGGIAKKVVKTILRDDYKPKLKNEKEVYSRVKQDYSDVIKNYEKTQKRKKRNRAAAVVGGAATALAIQSKKDKENKK